MINLKSVFSRSLSVVPRKTGREYVLVPVTDNIADMKNVYTLNETGAFIWEQIDGIKSVNDIIEAVRKEFDVDYDTASDDVIEIINDMNDHKLIVT